MKKILFVALTSLTLTACGSATVASHTLVAHHAWVLSCNKDELAEPSFFVLDCAVTSPLLADATWTHWGTHHATGTARLGIAPCNPVCKVASMDFYPNASVDLTDPTTVDGRANVFDRITVNYTFLGKRYSFTKQLTP